jgi:hypothetical protein
MKRSIKFLNCIAGVVVLALLIGCLPIPHTTERSPEIYGSVLDASTRSPIQGARIFLSGHPDISCASDSTGHFRLKATHNFNFGSVPPEGDWPSRTYWGSSITVSHANYAEFVQHEADDWRLTDKGDILLKPDNK